MNRNEINSNNTKSVIAEAYKKLIEQNPDNTISVSAVIKEANINRNTFYYHFENTDSLITWIIHNDMYAKIFHYETLTHRKEIRAFVMQYLTDNRLFLNNSIQQLGFDSFHRNFVIELFPVIKEYIDAVLKEDNMTLDTEYKEFLIEVFSELVSITFIKHFRNDRNRFASVSAINGIKLIFDLLIPEALKTKIDIIKG